MIIIKLILSPVGKKSRSWEDLTSRFKRAYYCTGCHFRNALSQPAVITKDIRMIIPKPQYRDIVVQVWQHGLVAITTVVEGPKSFDHLGFFDVHVNLGTHEPPLKMPQEGYSIL